MSRSSSGCWTCRLRHRKCDESTPSCHECEKKDIQCHGYGEKPAWMDGESLEQAERARIQALIKLNRKRTRTAKKASSAGSRIAAKTDVYSSSLNVSLSDGILQHHSLSDNVLPPDNLFSLETAPKTVDEIDGDRSVGCQVDDTMVEVTASPPTTKLPVTTRALNYQEANLVMHYLDHVFPLQYSHVNFDPSRSRGWLLWLLMKNEPLHQAVLSLAALHQYALDATRTDQRLGDLHTSHALALQGLHQFLGESLSTGPLQKQQIIELLACGTSLISFEVFRGGTEGWQPHLDGLASILQCTSWRDAGEGAGTSITAINPGHAESGWMGEAYRFLAAVVIWFDILSCLSTAQKPRLDHKTWFRNHALEMSLVMGCQNWVLDEIGALASLDAWKLQAVQSRTLSVPSLVARGQVSQNQLEQGLAEMGEVTYQESEVCAITRVYALSALVYLHTIVSGSHPDIPEINAAVELAIAAFDQVQQQRLHLRSLIWPMCIVGSVGKPKHYSYFESLISVAVGQGAGLEFGNVGSALQIMRQCWKEQPQATTAGYGYRDAMSDLSVCVLLI